MRADSFRFRPPPYELSAELEWALTRAFGPLPARPLEPRPELAVRWAEALGLGERIADRLPRRDAERELGAERADSLWRGREALVARTLLLLELLERAAATAVEIGTTVVALKGVALLETGAAASGGRPLLDLDLLVDLERAGELHAALAAAGLERSGSGERHHLAPLADPRLGAIELHRHLPGVRIAGRRPATAGDLRRAGLLRPSGSVAGLELPVPALLAGHALAHALDQHGLSPTVYPVTRLVADLIDLAGAPGAPAEPPSAAAAGWLAGAVSRRELEAAEALTRALAAGRPGAAGDDGRALLRHTALAFSSPGYRRRLRRRAAWQALRRRRWSKFRSELSRRVRRRFPLN